MKRKLVKQGTATLMISLPAKWTKRFNLRKGDEIDIEESDNALVVSKEGIKIKRETEINITKHTESSIRTLIVNTYRLGYDVVKVHFKTKKQFEILKNILKAYLVGFEITSREKDYCIIESITEPSYGQFDVLMRKILYNITLLIETTKKRLLKKEPSMNYSEISLKIHQYDSFCRRVISKGEYSEKNPQLFWAFQTLIVHGQRELYHLNRYLDKTRISISDETIKYIDKLSELFELLKKAYLEQKTPYLEEAHEMEKKLILKDGYALLSKKKGSEVIIISRISSAIRNFYLATSPLLGLLLYPSSK